MMTSTRSLEKEKQVYCLCSLDSAGNTVYLRSLHDHKWEIVTDIEIATKANTRKLAQTILEGYEYDVREYNTFVVVPCEITWTLIEED